MGAHTVRTITLYAIASTVFVGLLVFLLYPIGLTVRGGFAADVTSGEGWTLDHLRMLFRDPTTLTGLLNAFAMGAVATLLSMLIGVPLAVLSAGYRFPFKGLMNALILVPLILPPFVGAIGLKMVLGRAGALNSMLGTEWDILGNARFWGVVITQALHLYPIIYLNAVASLANLDPALDESAENLGAGRWKRFFTITLPLIRPGLFAGGTIVFIWAFTELGTPLMFDFTRVTPVQIFNGLKEVEANPEPYALTLVMLLSAVALYLVGKVLFGRRGHAMQTRASRSGGEVTLKGPVKWLATLGFAGVILLAIVPHLGVVLVSLAEPGSWYNSVLPKDFTLAHFGVALSADDSFTAIKNSLILSTFAVMVNLVVGVVVSYLVVRTNIKGRGLLDALCMLPLAVPGLVMAFGYVAMTLRWPFGDNMWLDGTPFDLEVFGAEPNPFPLLVIAYAVRRLPYIVRSASAGLEQTAGDLEDAAVNLGAHRLTAVRKVVLPLVAANLVAGSVLVFAFSMLEVSDSLILAQRVIHFPITKAIFEFSNRLGDGPYIASAMGVWGMALLTVTLFGASMLMGKKLGAIFRV